MSKGRYSKGITNTVLAGLICMLVSPLVFAADGEDVVTVNVVNFVKAETAAQFDNIVRLPGSGLNSFFHFRLPTPIEQQTVIRMNRDTLYSGSIVDISKGATLTVPDAGERYLSIMVVNEDHFINRIYHSEGVYELTMEEFDTPYVLVASRIFMDASDPEDIRKANALQDQITISAASSEPYTHPNYDQSSYEAVYGHVIELSRGIVGAFGKKEEVSEILHLLGTINGFGGLPEEEAYYLNVDPKLPVGAYQLTVKDVPVNAFWSISLYNKAGFFEKNQYDAYSVNNSTGTPNQDGSFTIHFGGDPKSANYLPIQEGWNYTVRMYQPKEEVLSGAWTFPGIKAVQ